MEPLIRPVPEGRAHESFVTVPNLMRISVRTACAAAVLLPLLLGGWLFGAPELVKALCYFLGLILASAFRPGRRMFDNSLKRSGRSRSLRLLALLFGAFVLIIAIQLFPLPLSALELISGQSARIYSRSVGSFGFLSLQPGITWNSLSWLIALSIFVAWFVGLPRVACTRELVYLPPEKGRRRPKVFRVEVDYVEHAFLTAILCSGVLVACIAASHHLLGAKSLFGFITIEKNELRAHLPFVNPNHLAVMMEVTVVLAVGRVLQLLEIGSAHGVWFPRKILACGFGALAAITAVLLSVSRLGIVLSLSATAILLCFWYYTRLSPFLKEAKRRAARSRISLEQRFVVGLSLAGVGLFAVVLLVTLVGESGRETLQLRFTDGVSQGLDAVRRSLVIATSEALSSYALFGAGLGCWHLAVAPFVGDNLAHIRLDYAHNEYLQLLLEVGVIGFLPFVVGLFAFALTVSATWKKTLAYAGRLELLTLLLAVLLPLVHGFFDFPFRIPALAYVCVMLLTVLLRVIDRAQSCPWRE